MLWMCAHIWTRLYMHGKSSLILFFYENKAMHFIILKDEARKRIKEINNIHIRQIHMWKWYHTSYIVLFGSATAARSDKALTYNTKKWVARGRMAKQKAHNHIEHRDCTTIPIVLCTNTNIIPILQNSFKNCSVSDWIFFKYFKNSLWNFVDKMKFHWIKKITNYNTVFHHHFAQTLWMLLRIDIIV